MSKAVLLLGGWLLMVPPSMPDGPGFDAKGPFSKWEQFSAYDTDKECETAQFEMILDDFRQVDIDSISSVLHHERMKASKCVPADAVRPAAKPAQVIPGRVDHRRQLRVERAP